MRFRFSIRDLLWMTVVVAFAMGWWQNRREADGWHTKFMQMRRDRDGIYQDARDLADQISELRGKTPQHFRIQQLERN